jgi:hypothetical protein
MSLHFPSDIASNSEHQHVFFLRVYQDETAPLGDSSKSGGEDMSSAVSSEVQKLSKNMAGVRTGSPRGDVRNEQVQVFERGVGKDEEGNDVKTMTEIAVDESTYAKSSGGIKDNVVLPFPHQISMSDGWTWETVSFQRSALGNMVTGNFASATQQAGQVVAGMAGKLFLENADKLIAHKMKRVVNPRKETMFQEPEQRTFSFSWEFTPRNQKDSDNLKEIIQFLKYSSAPSAYKGDHALFEYPSEYQIFFLSGGEENQYIGKIARCCMTSIKVDYAGGGIWSAFEGTNAPTSVKLSMDFRELALLARQDYKWMDGER